ncbi:hypothetical protein F2Q70_00013019 [Brassica cretica]|uniref:Uncharacterized protein n=1 Tax=Brassica cretica TaxID=69181 RepID=A0A8S9MBQ0_BRACR|nr:hypothetical protein F2Q70_00013019 [Brassica cretica]
MWCSNHLWLSCSLQIMAGSEPHQSQPHYQKRLGMGTCFLRRRVQWVGSSTCAGAV